MPLLHLARATFGPAILILAGVPASVEYDHVYSECRPRPHHANYNCIGYPPPFTRYAPVFEDEGSPYGAYGPAYGAFDPFRLGHHGHRVLDDRR